MKKTIENENKGTVVRTPRDVRATGVFRRVIEGDRKSGVADRVRHVSSENAKKQ